MLLAAVAAALAPAALAGDEVDLLSEANVQIDGAAGFDRAGWSVAGAGDVNGDGRDDVILSASFADNNSRTDSGSAYVVFGSASPIDVDLASLGAAGFRIDGAAEYDQVGSSVAAAGDVNRDGHDDVILGAPNADNNSRPYSGSGYVVFGSAAPTDVDLASLGAAGFRIDGAAVLDLAGQSVAGAGDVDGDGRDDVILGAPSADNNSRTDSGSAYVVFGSAAPTDIDLASLGAAGFRIDGAAAYDQAGQSVAGAGDVNGDGRDDVILGTPVAGNNSRDFSGSAYVVFGSAAPTDIDLAGLGAAGFRIDGAAADNYAGHSVAGVGDVNGDGRDDVILGATGADNNSRTDSGSAYVVFGDPDTDGDGINDGADNCPDDANAGQSDIDNDNIGDKCDYDKDGDGTLNAQDAYPRNGTEDTDTDGDGVGDNTDNCDNVPNNRQANQDNDAFGDACDSDRDGDTHANDEDAFPRRGDEWADSDSDGVGDNRDNCDETPNRAQRNLDGDSKGNACDDDIDGDDVPNAEDLRPYDATRQ